MSEFDLVPEIRDEALPNLNQLNDITVFIVSAMTNKPIRLYGRPDVWADGDYGPFSRFHVHCARNGLDTVVRFQCVADGGFLAIRGGQLSVGQGGNHCQFEFDTDGPFVSLNKYNNKSSRVGFSRDGRALPVTEVGKGGPETKLLIFDCRTVDAARRSRTREEEPLPQKLPQESLLGQRSFAATEFHLTPRIQALALNSLRNLHFGETVFIVSRQSKKPVQVNPNGSVTADGDLTQRSRFRVHIVDDNSDNDCVVRFENVATRKFLSVVGQRLGVGGVGAHSQFIFQADHKTVLLSQCGNSSARVGFNSDGQAVDVYKVQDGCEGRLMVFDCDEVVAPPLSALLRAFHRPKPQKYFPLGYPVVGRRCLVSGVRLWRSCGV